MLKSKSLLLTVIILYLVFSLIIFKVLQNKTHQKPLYSPSENRLLNLSHVIVHLDLKGAPPKLGYLTSLLTELKENGATGLLVEYEDMFPYEGQLVNLSARNCYKKDELLRFVKAATSVGLEVIPLVQTFGHLESALKLQEFQHLRELPAYPDSICPSAGGSRALVSSMLEQVLEFHQQAHMVKFVHIGCDEVFHINSCAACRGRELNNEDIFLRHVITTSADIKRKYPDITILIWDDMVRTISPLLMRQYNLRDYVEPVVWDYKPRVDIAHLTLFKYSKNFNNIWIASAFKGAHKKATTLPDVSNRMRNHLSWMSFISDYRMAGTRELYNFRGIIITGWSRFSHFDPLCELLPVSFPSLLLCMLTVKEFVSSNSKLEEFTKIRSVETNILHKMYSQLSCTEKDYFDIKFIDKVCRFTGKDLYSIVAELNDLVHSLMNEENAIHFENGNLVNFYVNNAHVNPNEMLKIKNQLHQHEKKLANLSKNLKNKMKLYFDDSVIDEYVNYKIEHVLTFVNKEMNKIKKIEMLRTWKRRPILIRKVWET